MVLTIPAIIAAQSAINSWDLLGHVNSLGKEIEITDNYIWGIGEAFDDDQQDWGLHVTAYNHDGTYHISEFINGEESLIGLNDVYGMVAMESDELFFCYISGYKKSDCVLYDLESKTFTSQSLQDDFSNNTLYPYIIRDFNKSPIVVAEIRNENKDLVDSIAVITYENGDKKTQYVKVPSNDYWIKDFVPLSVDKIALAIAYEDGGTEIMIIENGGIVNTVEQSQLIPSAILSILLENDNYIFTSVTGSSETGTLLIRPVIKKIDRDGNTVWVKDMKDEMGQVELLIGLVINHYLHKIIPAVDGDGYIYTGGEINNISEEAPLSWSYGVVGKISNEGEILWHKRYAVTDSTGYNYRIDDIEPDGMGGYITYGTAKHNAPGYFNWAAWMMRIDKDGNLIDDDVNNLNQEILKSSTILSPNPASEFIKASIDINQVKIINSLGEIVFEADEILKNNSIDISIYQAGNYFLIGTDNYGLRVRKAFIIIKGK